MADLRCELAGIRSSNPFWLASAPPTDKAYNVERAFAAGWGGVVWKTLGEDPPVINLSSRYGAISYNGNRMAGFSNIELISDRPLQTNLDEIARVKRRWPDRAVVISLMVPCQESSWRNILARVQDTGCDGIELNFGCPHGMSERQMGSAVGQVPEYVEMVTAWCKRYSRLPVIVKLTPNVTDILAPARAAQRGGADAVSLINTFKSIAGVDLDVMSPMPVVDGRGTHGGYCGPAVKPIALQMLADIAHEIPSLALSGIGGIATWRDAAEFISLGATSVQVCTAAMHYGFKIVEDMVDGLSRWMDDKGYASLRDVRRRAIDNYVHWNQLNMSFKTVAHIDSSLCIGCGLCYIGCEDTSHQAIRRSLASPRRAYEVIEGNCVGCNLCHLACPVEGCITMTPLTPTPAPITWANHPSNPLGQGRIW
jgi:dihydropyrimidine dehydrogenase (NAD+) subunit PreA